MLLDEDLSPIIRYNKVVSQKRSKGVISKMNNLYFFIKQDSGLYYKDRAKANRME